MGMRVAAGRTAGKLFTRLTLSRRRFETVVIGGGLIVLEFNEIRGNKASVTITAPRELAIDRGEVHERKQGNAADPVDSPAMGRMVEAARRVT